MNTHDLRDIWRRLGDENRQYARESTLDGAYYLDLAERCDLHLAVAELSSSPVPVALDRIAGVGPAEQSRPRRPTDSTYTRPTKQAPRRWEIA